MSHRNTVRCSALVVIVALALFSASTIARGSNQKPSRQSEASLMTVGQGVPDAEVVLKKKPGGQSAGEQDVPARPTKQRKPTRGLKQMEKRDEQPAGNKRTNKDGSFSFENVPVGTYNLTFDVPKVSPAIARKVEYLVIVQQVEVGDTDNSTAKTYDESKSKSARIAIAKINDGFDLTVGLQTLESGKSNIKNRPAVSDSQTRKAKESKEGNPPPAMNLRGKIFLVEIGTTKKWVDQP